MRVNIFECTHVLAESRVALMKTCGHLSLQVILRQPLIEKDGQTPGLQLSAGDVCRL